MHDFLTVAYLIIIIRVDTRIYRRRPEENRKEIFFILFNFFLNGRQPQFLLKIKDDLNFGTMKDKLKYVDNERQAHTLKWKKSLLYGK